MFGQTVHSAFPYSRYFYLNRLFIICKKTPLKHNECTAVFFFNPLFYGYGVSETTYYLVSVCCLFDVCLVSPWILQSFLVLA